MNFHTSIKAAIILSSLVAVGQASPSLADDGMASFNAVSVAEAISAYLDGDSFEQMALRLEGDGKYKCAHHGQLVKANVFLNKAEERKFVFLDLVQTGSSAYKEIGVCWPAEGSLAPVTLGGVNYFGSTIGIRNVSTDQIIFTELDNAGVLRPRVVYFKCDEFTVCMNPDKPVSVAGHRDQNGFLVIRELESAFQDKFVPQIEYIGADADYVCGALASEIDACAIKSYMKDIKSVQGYIVVFSKKPSANMLQEFERLVADEEESFVNFNSVDSAAWERSQGLDVVGGGSTLSVEGEQSFESTLCRTHLPVLEQIFYSREAMPVDQALSLVSGYNVKIMPFLASKVWEIYGDPDLAEQGMTSGGWMTSCMVETSR